MLSLENIMTGQDHDDFEDQIENLMEANDE